MASDLILTEKISSNKFARVFVLYIDGEVP